MRLKFKTTIDDDADNYNKQLKLYCVTSEIQEPSFKKSSTCTEAAKIEEVYVHVCAGTHITITITVGLIEDKQKVIILKRKFSKDLLTVGQPHLLPW